LVLRDQEEIKEILVIRDRLDQMVHMVKKAQREKLDLRAKLVYLA